MFKKLLVIFILFFSQVLLASSTAGVGIILEYVASQKIHRVKAVFKGSPAAKAKLSPGDVIVEVDGVNASNLSVSDLGNKIKGVAGSLVKLKLKDPHSGATREVSLQRVSGNKVSPLIEGASNSSPFYSAPSANKNNALSSSEIAEVKAVIQNLKTLSAQQSMHQALQNFSQGKLSKEEFLKKVRAGFN